MEHGFENGCVECETNFFWDKQKESNENGRSSKEAEEEDGDRDVEEEDTESDENGKRDLMLQLHA